MNWRSFMISICEGFASKVTEVTLKFDFNFFWRRNYLWKFHEIMVSCKFSCKARITSFLSDLKLQNFELLILTFSSLPFSSKIELNSPASKHDFIKPSSSVLSVLNYRKIDLNLLSFNLSLRHTKSIITDNYIY